jgi:hypothetical protein
MYHSLFNYLYESRLLFLNALDDEFFSTVGHETSVYLNPLAVNDLFHQCMSKQEPFQEFGNQCVKEYIQPQEE